METMTRKAKRKCRVGLTDDEVKRLKTKYLPLSCSWYWLEVQFAVYTDRGPDGKPIQLRAHDRRVYPPKADTPNCRMIRCDECGAYYPSNYIGSNRRITAVDGFDAAGNRVGHCEPDGGAWVLLAEGASTSVAGSVTRCLHRLGAERVVETVVGTCLDCWVSGAGMEPEAAAQRRHEQDVWGVSSWHVAMSALAVSGTKLQEWHSR